MDLHRLIVRQASTVVQVIHILCDQQKFICTLGQPGNRFMRGIRLSAANTLSPLAIPLPNEFRIARKRFRCRQL
jgi:hypothetical protein